MRLEGRLRDQRPQSDTARVAGATRAVSNAWPCACGLGPQFVGTPGGAPWVKDISNAPLRPCACSVRNAEPCARRRQACVMAAVRNGNMVLSVGLIGCAGEADASGLQACANDKQTVITEQERLTRGNPHHPAISGCDPVAGPGPAGARLNRPSARPDATAAGSGRYFLPFSGATPVCVRSHRERASSAAALECLAVDGGGGESLALGVSTSPSRSSSRVRARCGWRR